MTPPDKEPPAKPARRSTVEYSLFSGGDILDGTSILRSVLGRRVIANLGSEVTECIFFDRVVIGEGAKISRTIVCEDVIIPPHVRVGFSKEEDKKLGIHIDLDSGIRVIPRGFKFPSK